MYHLRTLRARFVALVSNAHQARLKASNVICADQCQQRLRDILMRKPVLLTPISHHNSTLLVTILLTIKLQLLLVKMRDTSTQSFRFTYTRSCVLHECNAYTFLTSFYNDVAQRTPNTTHVYVLLLYVLRTYPLCDLTQGSAKREQPTRQTCSQHQAARP